jgi:hypothetical protein
LTHGRAFRTAGILPALLTVAPVFAFHFKSKSSNLKSSRIFLTSSPVAAFAFSHQCSSVFISGFQGFPNARSKILTPTTGCKLHRTCYPISA